MPHTSRGRLMAEWNTITPDTFNMRQRPLEARTAERRNATKVEPFPQEWVLRDMRTRPWKYDESFVDHLLEMRNAWLTSTHQTEWDCTECETFHVTPDAEFHDDTPCPGRGTSSTVTRPEPTARPRGKRLPPKPDDNAPIVLVTRPTTADLPDLPDNATPAQRAEWRAAYERIKNAR